MDSFIGKTEVQVVTSILLYKNADRDAKNVTYHFLSSVKRFQYSPDYNNPQDQQPKLFETKQNVPNETFPKAGRNLPHHK